MSGAVAGGREWHASLVVVADGAHSCLRGQLGLNGSPPRSWRVGVRTHLRLAPDQAQPPWVEVFLGRGYELYVTPLPDGEILVAGLAEHGQLAGGAERSLLRWVADQPVLRARLAGATRCSALRGMSPLGSRARASVVPGAVLLGDAAEALDPITGTGMARALISAELLATHVTRYWGGGDDWLGTYDRMRGALLRDERLLTAFVLGLAGHPWLARQMLRLLGRTPALFSHLLGIAAGSHHARAASSLG